jgi:hypothetical protein
MLCSAQTVVQIKFRVARQFLVTSNSLLVVILFLPEKWHFAAELSHACTRDVESS